jgi:hypothetical protein
MNDLNWAGLAWAWTTESSLLLRAVQFTAWLDWVLRVASEVLLTRVWINSASFYADIIKII